MLNYTGHINLLYLYERRKKNKWKMKRKKNEKTNDEYISDYLYALDYIYEWQIKNEIDNYFEMKRKGIK